MRKVFMSLKLLVLGFLISGLLIFQAAGEEVKKEEKAVELKEVVVTATRTEKPMEDVPGRVEVLTSEDVQNFAISGMKVDEVLNLLSGINVIRPQGVMTLVPTTTLRGLSNEQARTLVLLDGVPINKADTGNVNFNRINLHEIERIEIFKGPASSLYGNNAMGGVINIITKRPEKKFEGKILASYGTYNTYALDLFLSGRLKEGESTPYFRLSSHYLDTDGYVSLPKERRTPFTVKRFNQEGMFNLLLGYEFKRDNFVDFKIEYFDNKIGEGTKIYAEDGVHREFDTWAYSLRYYGNSGHKKWQIKTFWSNENYKRVSESLRAGKYTRFDVDSDRTDMGIDGMFSFNLVENQLVTIGADVREGRVDAWDIYKTSPDRAHNEGKLRIYGIWVQDELLLKEGKVSVLGGIRYDYAKFFDGSFYSTIKPFNKLSGEVEENSWEAISPRLSIRYKWTSHFSTYASYGRGFRASILDDLCRSGIMWGLYKVANPNLKPEKIDTFELGFDLVGKERFKISSSFYYSIGKDFLYYVPTGEQLDGRPLYRRENIDRVISYGAEFDLRYLLQKGLMAFVNYTYSKGYIDKFEQRPDIEGQTLTRNPKHMLKGGLTWLNPYINISLTANYKSSQLVYTNEIRQTTARLKAYTIADLKIWKEFKKGLQTSFSVQNIFDERYTESREEKSPGRIFMIEVSYRF